MQFRNPRERQRLQRLVEQIANEIFHLTPRGLWLHVNRIEVRGRPPESILAWANLHFLPHGSPFYSFETDAYLFVDPCVAHPVGDLVRRRLRLRQAVEFNFSHVRRVVHPGARCDRFYACVTEVPKDVNKRDELGRTALWRAAVRGYDDQVVSLLESGADPTIPDRDGQTLLDHVQSGRLNGYLAYLLEHAIAMRESLGRELPRSNGLVE